MTPGTILPLGDLTVFSPPDGTPAKLLKALAVIARDLHPRLQIDGYLTHGQCVLCSLTVRDFLQDIGFSDARVAPVAFLIRADRAGKPLHSLGIGVPGREAQQDKWNGHLVVVLEKLRWLIDPTLYQARRPQWPMLTGMVAIPLFPKPQKAHAIAGFEAVDGDLETYAAWLARPGNNGWVEAPDCINARRAPTVAAMRSAFGMERVA